MNVTVSSNIVSQRRNGLDELSFPTTKYISLKNLPSNVKEIRHKALKKAFWLEWPDSMNNAESPPKSPYRLSCAQLFRNSAFQRVFYRKGRSIGEGTRQGFVALHEDGCPMWFNLLFNLDLAWLKELPIHDCITRGRNQLRPVQETGPFRSCSSGMQSKCRSHGEAVSRCIDRRCWQLLSRDFVTLFCHIFVVLLIESGYRSGRGGEAARSARCWTRDESRSTLTCPKNVCHRIRVPRMQLMAFLRVRNEKGYSKRIMWFLGWRRRHS